MYAIQLTTDSDMRWKVWQTIRQCVAGTLYKPNCNLITPSISYVIMAVPKVMHHKLLGPLAHAGIRLVVKRVLGVSSNFFFLFEKFHSFLEFKATAEVSQYLSTSTSWNHSGTLTISPLMVACRGEQSPLSSKDLVLFSQLYSRLYRTETLTSCPLTIAGRFFRANDSDSISPSMDY